jgi:hypothetical protein
MRLSLVSLLALSGLLACQESRPPADAPGRRPAYHVVKYLRRSQTCASPDSLCATARIVYPVFDRDVPTALNDSIRYDVSAGYLTGPDAPVTPTPEALGREFTENFDAFVASQRGEPFYASVWELDVRATMLRQTAGYLGLGIETYSYEGGAHPNTFTRYVNYDLRTGRRLRLSDLFRPGTEADLRARAEARFRQQEGLGPDAPLTDYFFANNRFALNDNVTLTPTGLQFFYNPYEIKPYAAGPTKLEVPWSEVRALLRPGAPVP